MAIFLCHLLVALVSIIFVHSNPQRAKRQTDNDTSDRLALLEQGLEIVARQLMQTQFYMEEQTRSRENSGLKRLRNSRHGSKSYYSRTHIGNNFAAIHNHANFERTVGIGEFVGILNGVEFRTRHNDYMLKMKSRTSSEFGATQDIPFPDVPPAVTPNMSIADQVTEMKEWFKAWADQDYSVRDYRPYFKPVLCYLEGSWTNSDQNSIDESFESDRHSLDASSWLDLLDKVRFTSYAGSKDELENFAYLPTTIFSLGNDSVPILAQWNYRILCHPLDKDLPLNRLVVIDDFKGRVYNDMTYEKYVTSRSARFQIALEDAAPDEQEDKSTYYSYLDDLMREIPGADNYLGEIEDDLYGYTAYPYDEAETDPMNVAYYNRIYRVAQNDAVGSQLRRRGFGDENLFVAQTNQSKIAGLEFKKCNKKGRKCEYWFQRWTYAVPLEIVYLTPLSSWNPYEIPNRGDGNSDYGKTVFEGPNGPRSRNGNNNVDRAYNGSNSKTYYITPLEFFQSEFDTDPADTTKDDRAVLDPKNETNFFRLRATGIRITMPEIPGVGSLRQRYPIVPVTTEGEGTWKELDVVKEMVMFPSKYKNMFRDEILATTPIDDV